LEITEKSMLMRAGLRRMYHGLRTVDLMISAEIAVRDRPHLTIGQTFLEYRMVKRRGRIERETSDYVANGEISENRIIPDAAIIIENIETKKRALFFIEMDMATERIVTNITRDKSITVRHKISQYDRYLQSLRYRETYAPYGKFGFFTMLFITLNKERVEHIRQSTHDLPAGAGAILPPHNL
jgi:Replication-relaxation